MSIEQETRAYEEARRRLLEFGIHSKAATMVLFAMLDTDKDYPTACEEYAAFVGKPTAEVKAEIGDAIRNKGLWLPAREVLERLYLEALGYETQWGGTDAH